MTGLPYPHHESVPPVATESAFSATRTPCAGHDGGSPVEAPDVSAARPERLSEADRNSFLGDAYRRIQSGLARVEGRDLAEARRRGDDQAIDRAPRRGRLWTS